MPRAARKSGAETKENQPLAPPKKRARKGEKAQAAPKRRGNRGKLELILQVPIEVFSRVASNLSPLDLLHVSRTNRAVRRYLLSKSSRPIWCAALANYDVPKPYPGWTELRLSRFLFEEVCEVCDCRSSHVNFQFRCRMCRGCEKQNMFRGSQIIYNNYSEEEVGLDVLYTLVPYYSPLDLPHMELEVPYLEQYLSGQFFDENQLVQMAERYFSLENNPSEQKKFVKERQARVKEIMKCARDFIKWAAQYAKRKEKDKEELCKQREKEVQNRLLALGYSKRQITTFDEMSCEWHMLVHIPKPLTERTWKNLLPKLQPILDIRKPSCDAADYRGRVIERRIEFWKLYQSYLKDANLGLEVMRFMPPVEDIMIAPLARKLIEENGAKDAITKEMWDGALAEGLQDCIEDFKPKARETLEGALKAAREELLAIPQDERPAWHSTALKGFTVDGPTAFFRSAYSVKSIGTFMKSLRDDFYAGSGRVNSLADRLSWDYTRPSHEVALIAGAVLYSMKRDEVTMNELECLGKRFVCMCCPRERRVCCSWEELVLHFMEFNNRYKRVVSKNKDNSVPFVNSHELDAAHTQELAIVAEDSFVEGDCNPKRKHEHADDNQGRYRCKLCEEIGEHYTVSWLSCFKHHMRLIHGKETEPRDYVYTAEQETVAAAMGALI